MKKYLKYIILSFICIFSFLPQIVKADYNSNTTYTLNIPNEKEYLSQYTCGTDNVYTFTEYIIDTIENASSTYANIEIYLGMNSGSVDNENILSFYAWPKNYDMKDNFYALGKNVSSKGRFQISHSYNTFNSNNTFYYFEIKLNGCSSNSANLVGQASIDNFISFVLYGTYNTGVSNSVVSQFKKYDYYSSPYWNCFISLLDNTFTNDNSYTINNNWIYYSTIPIKLGIPSDTSQEFYKNIIINDIEYSVGDIIPSVHDLESSPPTPTFIGYKTSLDTFYTDITLNDFSSYSLTIDFNVPQSLLGYYQTPQEYIDNTSFDFVCSGRINYSNYYQYRNHPCSLNVTTSYTDNFVRYVFNGISTSDFNGLFDYDKIYVTIIPKYLNNDISTTLFNLTYTYSYGSFFNTEYKGAIYENFSNLPLNFKMYFSSNNSLDNSSLYVRKSNFIDYNIKYNGFSNTTQSMSVVIGSSILGSIDNENEGFVYTQVSNSIDTGIMIYQQNGIALLPRLDLFFNSGMYISINNVADSNSFYYVDSTGTIQNNNFVKPVYTDDSNDYDISYYINKVSSFIDDLSNDCVEFGNITQNFYNGLPVIFQTFILVIFILACIYFTYLLINRR